MAYDIDITTQFKRDAKRCQKRNLDISLFETVLKELRQKGEIPSKYKPHILKGNYKNHWECHIQPDWLLIWKQNDELKEIILVRMGTHSDLF